MLIAIDYDGTYTADKVLWNVFIEQSILHGHSIIVATMRYGCEGECVMDDLQTKVDQIIFTSRAAKKPYLEAMGISPDIWIDDIPEFILTDAAS